ncbi:MAG TPA: hypothetical protein VK631_21160 [Solirubrobacteraceae bacterium]|nr:hypothetical protein [Solirubrobacteraceae bacterium]
MADDATTTDATTTTTTTDTATAAAAGKTFTQEQVNDLLAREKGTIQGKYADYDDLKAAATRLAEIEESKKTAEQKLTGERDALKGQTDTLAQQNARLKVALKKGLTGDRAELADLLQGKDEKEMEAHADKLLKLMGGPNGSTNFDGGARGDAPAAGDMDALIRRASGRT